MQIERGPLGAFVENQFPDGSKILVDRENETVECIRLHGKDRTKNKRAPDYAARRVDDTG